jgi:hypothetical protein
MNIYWKIKSDIKIVIIKNWNYRKGL